MPDEIIFVREEICVPKPRAKRPRPNRIFDLTKQRKWTYPEVALRVRKIAAARGDDSKARVHTVTINKLATGQLTLTQEWMKILGDVFGVPPAEIISAPFAENLRRVVVCYALEAGNWRRTPELPANEQYDIMIRNEAALQSLSLYACEIKGPDVNLRYPIGAIVVIAKLEPGALNRPGEVIEGKRYHVRVMRDDGLVEDSIKQLTAGPEGQFWLKPESNHPAHQEWTPLAGRSGQRVEILGRVRGVFLSED